MAWDLVPPLLWHTKVPNIHNFQLLKCICNYLLIFSVLKVLKSQDKQSNWYLFCCTAVSGVLPRKSLLKNIKSWNKFGCFFPFYNIREDNLYCNMKLNMLFVLSFNSSMAPKCFSRFCDMRVCTCSDTAAPQNQARLLAAQLATTPGS